MCTTGGDVVARNFARDSEVCIVQADALNLPIRDEVTDAIFSIGVLHLTLTGGVNPSAGVREAHRLLRDSGWLALCVYYKGGYYDSPSVQGRRKLFKLLSPVFDPYPAPMYTYAIVYGIRPIVRLWRPLRWAARLVFPFANHPDVRWSIVDTFDGITPSYQSTHEPYELFQWFKNAGFSKYPPAKPGALALM